MTAWQTLFLSDDEATASCYGKSVRFFMKSGIYTGFSFWHPAKIVTECGGLYGLTYNAETWVFKLKRDEKQGEKGLLPVVVIDKPLSDRIASTIRHNRARGTHDIDLMVNIVKELKECGQSDTWIMKHLGMDAEELLRLKQVSGLASLFADKEFSPADPEMV